MGDVRLRQFETFCFGASVPLVVASLLAAGSAHAQVTRTAPTLLGLPDESGREVLLLSIMIGVIGFAIVLTLWLMRERRRGEAHRVDLERELATAKARLARSDALLELRDQRIVVWTAGEERPYLRGRLPLPDVPEERDAFVSFATWMAADTAGPFLDALDRLREGAAPFDMVGETRGGAMIEIEGRTSGAQAFVRFSALSEERAAHARDRDEHARVAARLDTLVTLFEQMDWPAWMRDAGGRMTFVNRAYVHAVEGTSVEGVERHATPLLDRKDRDAAKAHHDDARSASAARVSVWHKRLPVTVAGDRRMLDVTEACTASGTAGFAVDMNEIEQVRASFQATVGSHVRTLDHLTSAVASFDEHRRLRFYNQAFLKLWGLAPATLEDAPDNASVFEELRAHGRIAEQSNFREWRDGILEVYQAESPYEDRWLLPDGRTVRVLGNPEPSGGVTWVFENVTEQQELETAFAELTRVQGETLDHLSEAVAVFGSDGRLKLSNPAFRRVWGLPEELVQREAPLAAIADAMQQAAVAAPGGEDEWDELVPAITGTGERSTRSGRLVVRSVYDANPASLEPDRRVLDYALVPLPNGQAMMTFTDLTASTRVEQALLERNEALSEAEETKNRFLNQISVSFRRPLQSIGGFADMLHSEMVGPLAPQQKNYVNYIMSSGAELTLLVDNMLDLAAMQAGRAELDLEQLPAEDLLKQASLDVAGLLADRGLTLEMEVAASAGSADMDGPRVRRAMTNLLSNAARHSPPGGRVRIECLGDSDALEVFVSDEGPGIAPEMHETVFRNFEAGVAGGAGLGLAIVRTVLELHGGTIEIEDGAEHAERARARSEKAPLGGASFRIRLPRAADRHSAAS